MSSAFLCVLSASLSWITDSHTTELGHHLVPPSVRVSVMSSAFSNFVSIDLGLVILTLTVFLGGCCFLPAALKLLVITGSSGN